MIVGKNVFLIRVIRKKVRKYIASNNSIIENKLIVKKMIGVYFGKCLGVRSYTLPKRLLSY